MALEKVGNNPFGFIDRAETFAESDVTVGGTAPIVNESISVPSASQANTDLTSTENKDGPGVEFQLHHDATEIEVKLGPTVESLNAVELREGAGGGSTGTLIDSVSSVSPGDTVTFTGTFNAGDWGVVIDESGPFPTVSSDTTNSNVSSEMVTLTDGLSDKGSSFGFHFLVFEYVRAVPTLDYSATVEWPHPPDVFGWDTATFQADPDGETVDVFVEESTDGGSTWTEVAGPIARGDDIPVASDNEMRFRVDFSRSNTSNNPTLDAIYRRYLV
jgi:hypothetical protein